jgi:4-amino-4-deoxy-L-arabinose transferase-like glycosyltransferase
MKFLKKYSPAIFLIITLIVGAFFRFSKLGSSPSGLYVDEASIGYSAFSVLKTGRDEYGKTLPILFRSFSTFQSPVYTYLTVPFIYLFGLSPFSTRLPSALFGTLSIILIYFIAKQLFLESNSNDDTKEKTLETEIFAQCAAFFMAISPWHIQYSRTAYESNIALFFLLLGSLMFFYALRRPWLFTFSFVFYGISPKFLPS